jgi:hypothetical protein
VFADVRYGESNADFAGAYPFSIAAVMC